jgi:hypothetical protein
VFGPLSTFSSKIRINYAIDLLQDCIECDLDLVRRIRNEFAVHYEDFLENLSARGTQVDSRSMRKTRCILVIVATAAPAELALALRLN